jgi:hypothetical protein
MQRKYIGIFISIMFLTVSPALAGDRGPVKPHVNDKCPVCDMFPAKHPDFAAQIIFKDGSYAVFDGVKDLFKYYFDNELSPQQAAGYQVGFAALRR